MTVALPGEKWTGGLSDAEALHQLSRIVLAVIDEEVTEWAADQYRKLRDGLLSNNEYSDVIPTFLRTYRSLSALSTFLGNLQPAPGATVQSFVEDAFINLNERADAIEQADPVEQYPTDFLNDRPDAIMRPVPIDRSDTPVHDQVPSLIHSSSEWTGLPTARSRIAAVKELFPAVLQSLEAMVPPEFGHNHGPPIDDDEAGLEAIRDLHSKLGEILDLAQRNALNNVHLTGIIAELADYTMRARDAVKKNPLKYAVIGGISALGGFIWGGAFIAGAALTATFEVKDR